MLTSAEAMQRIAVMQTQLKSKGLDGALFIFPIDVYYFTGTRQNSTLWIPADGEALLLVRKSLSRAREEALVADIRPFPSSKEFPGLFGEDIRKIGLTFDVAPVQQMNYYAKLLPGREFVDISGLNREVRSVKSPFELEQLRLSGRELCTVFAQVPQFLKAGMRELDLSAEFEYRLRKAGNEGYVRMRAFNQELFLGLAVSAGGASYGFFDGAVTGCGLSNASPHGASRQTICENVPILIDYTGVFNGYITDMTRIYVIGRLDPELQRAFDVSLEIQSWLQGALKPGAVCEELFLSALEMANRAGLGQYFMGMPGEQARFVGHGVGLELDEFPVIAQGFKVALQAGQTIAIEPKFVIPGKGVIGIENTFAVSAAGGEKITDLPDNITFI
ncbi:MAG: aminopeptidase P family protein [Steroidobacteraceae bacterium]|nr:aminopeptidase P family protein [Deltaproteobacteria bacterium]